MLHLMAMLCRGDSEEVSLGFIAELLPHGAIGINEPKLRFKGNDGKRHRKIVHEI